MSAEPKVIWGALGAADLGSDGADLGQKSDRAELICSCQRGPVNWSASVMFLQMSGRKKPVLNTKTIIMIRIGSNLWDDNWVSAPAERDKKRVVRERKRQGNWM